MFCRLNDLTTSLSLAPLHSSCPSRYWQKYARHPHHGHSRFPRETCVNVEDMVQYLNDQELPGGATSEWKPVTVARYIMFPLLLSIST